MNREDENLETRPLVSGVLEGDFKVPQGVGYLADAEPRDYDEAPRRQKQSAYAQQSDFETEQDIINWQAQDMLVGEKNKQWFIYFGVIVVILLGAAWFLMGNVESWSFIVVIIMSAAAILTTRTNRGVNIINYALSTRGVYVGNDYHEYSSFKSFGILKEKGVYSIILKPKKRFAPTVSIYFPKEKGEKITDILGARLPMESVELDIVERLIRKINL